MNPVLWLLPVTTHITAPPPSFAPIHKKFIYCILARHEAIPNNRAKREI